MNINLFNLRNYSIWVIFLIAIKVIIFKEIKNIEITIHKNIYITHQNHQSNVDADNIKKKKAERIKIKIIEKIW